MKHSILSSDIFFEAEEPELSEGSVPAGETGGYRLSFNNDSPQNSEEDFEAIQSPEAYQVHEPIQSGIWDKIQRITTNEFISLNDDSEEILEVVSFDSKVESNRDGSGSIPIRARISVERNLVTYSEEVADIQQH